MSIGRLDDGDQKRAGRFAREDCGVRTDSVDGVARRRSGRCRRARATSGCDRTKKEAKPEPRRHDWCLPKPPAKTDAASRLTLFRTLCAKLASTWRAYDARDGWANLRMGSGMDSETRENSPARRNKTEVVASRRATLARGGAVALGVAAGMLAIRQPAAADSPVYGESSTNVPGVWGVNTQVAEPGGGGPGVRGDSANGHGVRGQSVTGSGVRGIHTSPTEATGAIVGVNQGAGAGVVGRAGNGPGMRGIAPGGNPGVFAESGSQPGSVILDGGMALLALGRALVRPPNESDLSPGDAIVIDPTSSIGPTLEADGDQSDPAIRGSNTQVAGPGDGGAGVQGLSANGFAVHGISTTSAGVVGIHTSPTESSSALIGRNRGLGVGVDGRAEMGPGVRGNAPGAIPAVQANSGSRQTGTLVLDGAVALVALGHTILRPPTAADGSVVLDPNFTTATLVVTAGTRTDALFMPVGNGSILAGQQIAVVTNAAAGVGSHISVALVGSPARNDHKPPAVSWIERVAGSFTVHLTDAVDFDTPFTYTIVNP